MSPRPGRAGRLWILQLAMVVLVCACGGASTSPSASATSPTATPGPRQTASPTPTEAPSIAPSMAPSIAPSRSPGEIVACPGTVEVVRSQGTPATDLFTHWAGYAVSSKSTPFTCVEAAWTQPSVVCRGTGLAAVAFWVGIGGVGQAGLVQVGTQTQCVHGSPVASAWQQSLPKEPNEVNADLVVSVGDRLRAQVLAIGHASYALSIDNLTTGARFTVTTVNRTVDPTTAEWITEAPTFGCPTRCAIASLPDFGTVTFSDVSTTIAGVNGPLDAAGFVHTRTTLVTTSGRVRARVSDTAQNGRSFAVSWERP